MHSATPQLPYSPLPYVLCSQMPSQSPENRETVILARGTRVWMRQSLLNFAAETYGDNQTELGKLQKQHTGSNGRAKHVWPVGGGKPIASR
jgi:hypothetical protein